MLKDIAAWCNPPLSTSAICRFKMKSLSFTRDALASASSTISNNGATQENGVIQAAARTAMALAIDPFVQRCLQHQQTIDDALTETKAGKGKDTVAGLVGADLRGLELYAKFTGRLDSGTHIQVSVVVGGAGSTAAEPDGLTIDIKPDR